MLTAANIMLSAIYYLFQKPEYLAYGLIGIAFIIYLGLGINMGFKVVHEMIRDFMGAL